MAVIATKSSLDKAFNVSAIQTRDFLLKLSESLGKTLAEDDAISLMTGGVDFAVTQVVDQNWGVHGKTDGSVYEEYSPVSFPGTSLNGTCKYSQKYAYKRA
ncbi:hypothetical protein MNEG_7259 [Monoraphidium neglectum]|uniref:Uncharacterized protein n=1 Tax=Monoraphidium neglectum TaxID=145388 RepID=A0A0D2KZW6_9CHLO|nr:hypothetical protein MNEG_7259 [Monoraphidium neglectum]KIZ00699.1 hypothetical protein MNEG_7259 [Monoraphidium neglectum]|eukprot:XP_013899718.1 hypothetical protein MNEG_7259 [Monoraphidium neglectum]